MESINIKKILINSFIVIIIFLLDRLSKIYILNLIDADKFTESARLAFEILPFLCTIFKIARSILSIDI